MWFQGLNHRIDERLHGKIEEYLENLKGSLFLKKMFYTWISWNNSDSKDLWLQIEAVTLVQ